MQEINIEMMEQEVLSGETIVEFGADWCGPCRAILPILEELSSERKIIRIDIEKESPEQLNKYNIRSIPTVIAFKDGKIHKKLVGMQTKITLQNIFN